MYYYLTVSFDIADDSLNEGSKLCGPFKSVKLREKALEEDLNDRDLECGENVNVTMLTLRNDGTLHRTRSFVPAFEDFDMDLITQVYTNE